MKNENFCCAENMSVLIPYSDLEKLMRFANEMDSLNERLSKMDKRMGALNGLYSELLQKVGDLNRMLQD